MVMYENEATMFILKTQKVSTYWTVLPSTLAKQITHSPKNKEDLGLTHGILRYIVADMTTLETAVIFHWVLSPNGRPKNPRDSAKWSYLTLCLSVRGMSVTRELGL